MSNQSFPIYVGETSLKRRAGAVSGKYVPLLGERFYKIGNYDALEPFFMSIISGSDHWLFLSSTGGLSAGRVSAEQALFPYYTEDKLAENAENTGNKAILLVKGKQRASLWEPFSVRQAGVYQVERNIYKNTSGTAVVFEEVNQTLGLTYRYAWRTSEAFGFVKTTWLLNQGGLEREIELVDGLQNILPANITSATQNIFSPLLDAYKRSEVDPATGLAIFALNSSLTDLAEASESLLATTVMQIGLDAGEFLLSARQLDAFRAGLGIEPEAAVRGQRCAYFVHACFDLARQAERCWHVVAEVCQDGAAIVRLSNQLKGERAVLVRALENDLAANGRRLEQIVASADGLQVSRSPLRCGNHFANVLFNEMRGGLFADQYRVERKDLTEYIALRNPALLAGQAEFFGGLPATITIADLKARAETSGSADLIRLSQAYLPLTFSRRHGDPSRPWNRFAIQIKNEDGSAKLGYEGNWRDIFQNWEALAYAYPEFVESMLCTFLDATTLDGYNPYRITRQGIDWEIPEPGNPWANIGYWGDHQIIYLQKLIEVSARMHPGRLESMLAQGRFSYAQVPYRIKEYAQLLEDPFNTIDFDWTLQREIEQRVREGGTDGKLVARPGGGIAHANLAEKLLTLLMAKLVNFVPEGGIWMNTQRPEWNDANNALVGKGLSVVTLCYVRRMVVFFGQMLGTSGLKTIAVSREVQAITQQVARVFEEYRETAGKGFTDQSRRAMLDALGQAGSAYRAGCYAHGFSGEGAHLAVDEVSAFLDRVRQTLDLSLRANQRSDHLFQAYNILHLAPGSAAIGHMVEMLEGQVAILSSGLLSGEESLALLESLRAGRLFRADQHSYLLYPDRELVGFLEKNRIAAARVQGMALGRALVEAQDRSLITWDENGDFHFNGQMRNVKDVRRALSALGRQPRFAELVQAESAALEALFEELFNHAQFTGRSGTFFAYEGLGSIYWHMVSKLVLAVQETIVRMRHDPSLPGLLEHYADLCQGQSIHKSPAEYGAFPTDPYSHTPRGRGAQQPGMTGMVKEDILTRQAELGLFIENGKVKFDFLLLDKGEFLDRPAPFTYWDVAGQQKVMELPAGCLAYSICQVPVILQLADKNAIEVQLASGESQRVAGHLLDAATSRHIFERDGVVDALKVTLAG